MAVILSDRVKAVVSNTTLPEPPEPPTPAAGAEETECPRYPNADGLVKCCYCIHLDGYRCTEGHRPDGLALLRECVDFSFKRKD